MDGEKVPPLPYEELFEPPRIPRYTWATIIGDGIQQEGDIAATKDNTIVNPNIIGGSITNTTFQTQRFIDLTDVPASYVGQSGLFVKVKVTEDGLEFGVGGGGGSGNRCVSLVLYGSGTSVAVGDGVYGIAIPSELEGYLLTEATGAVATKGITGSMTIQIRRRRAGANADMLNTKITLADVYYNTTTDVVVANADVSEGDMIYADIDTKHTTAAKGLSIVLTFVAP